MLLLMPAALQSPATSSSLSRRVTTTISRMQSQSLRDLSVLVRTLSPPNSIFNLSSPIRREDPAATTTALQLVFFARRMASESFAIGVSFQIMHLSRRCSASSKLMSSAKTISEIRICLAE